MLALVVFAVALLVVEGLVWRYGADSRDGNDWTVRCAPRESPPIG